jgi:Fic family protein
VQSQGSLSRTTSQKTPQKYVEARAALAELRQAGQLIPNQAMLINANLVDQGVARRQTAATYLKNLVEIGVLQEWKSGRDKLFIHPRFLRLLTTDGNEVEPYL